MKYLIIVFVAFTVTACATTQSDELPLDPAYALEVCAGTSPVKMPGDADRVLKWAKRHHISCN